jgi:predicted permease
MVVGLIADKEGNPEWVKDIGKIGKIAPLCVVSAASAMLVSDISPETVFLIGLSPMAALLTNSALRYAKKVYPKSFKTWFWV